MRVPRSPWPGHFVAIAVGVLVGTVVASAAASIIEPSSLDRVDPPAIAGLSVPDSPSPVVTPDTTEPRVLLAWASGGLPPHAEARLQRHRSTRRVTTVRTSIDWLRQPTEDLVDGAVPIEVALVRPREYAHFVPPAEGAALQTLTEGDALLARSAVGLHRSSSRGSLRLVDRDVRVRGTIDDVAASGYEAIIAGRVPASWSRVDRFLLIHLRREADRADVEKQLRRLLRPGQALRVRARGETPFLRYGDAVLPQLLIKKTFGEFSARPVGDGTIVVDPEWKRRNILTANVPVLGEVTCHRAMIPQLRSALTELERNGLSHTIDTSEYGGCFSPRFIGMEPKGRLSHHTWGIAIDLNVADNAFATKSDQDPRLVEIMERHGFTWGGRWLVPDAMHFEWVEFP